MVYLLFVLCARPRAWIARGIPPDRARCRSAFRRDQENVSRSWVPAAQASFGSGKIALLGACARFQTITLRA
jgi:hypothetical protein